MKKADVSSAALRLGAAIVQKLERTLAPKRCVFCGVITLPPERFVCGGCTDDLPWIRYGCTRCGTPLPAEQAAGVDCASCQAIPPIFHSVVVPLQYAFPVDVALKALKFRRKLYYLPAFAEILLDASPGLPADIDAVLPVPLHRWRKMRRGFNQALELARPLRRRLGVPLLTNVDRTHATPYQSGLNALQRRRNLKAAFRLRGILQARHVLVVDDVITTGETCRSIASLLLRHGVERVSVLALARA